MSTRATYLFKGGEYRPDVCIYIHHDGYEQGAAYYFYNAFLAGSVDAESMIRGNERAEVTGSHELHGDTEYRYTISGNDLIAEKGYGDDWRTIYSGDWIDFVNKYISADWVDNFQPLKCVDIGYFKGQVHTPTTLSEKLSEELRLCGTWATNGDKESANMKDLKERIKTMRGLLDGYGSPAWAVQS